MAVAALLLLTFATGLAGTGVLTYHGTGRLILIAGLAAVFGAQNVAARIVGIGSDSRLAGGTGEREKLRFGAVLTMCPGAVVGATLSRFVVAPVIALAGVMVAAALAVFRYGPRAPKI